MNVMKHLSFSLLIASLVISWTPARAEHTLVVLPFEDHSGFKDHWDLRVGLSELLSDRLADISGYSLNAVDSSALPLSLDSGECGGDTNLSILTGLFDSLQVGYMISGRVEEFGISRFGVASPTVGGYQSYRAGVKVSFSLWEQGIGTALLTDESIVEIKQRGLGLTLLGKPTDEMQEYEMLDQLEFGSEEFMATIIGQAVDTLLTNIVEKIQTVLPPQTDLGSVIGPAVIVSLDEDQVYINRGYEDGIKVGDQFCIYTQGEELRDPETDAFLGYSDRKVGTIQVSFVKSAHLSVAEVVEKKGEMKPGDEVRVW